MTGWTPADYQRDAMDQQADIGAPCPACGHQLYRHGDHHWPEGTCAPCRAEMNPYASGSPRKPEDVCSLTSSEVSDAIRFREDYPA